MYHIVELSTMIAAIRGGYDVFVVIDKGKESGLY